MGNLTNMKLYKINPLKILSVLFIFSLFACMEEEKSVTLGSSVVEKGIMMTSSKSDQAKVEVYLITRDSVEGELLAKALNAKAKRLAGPNKCSTLARMMPN